MIARFGNTCGNQQHPDNTNRFLGIIATMTQAVTSSGYQLQAAEMLVDLAW